MSVLFGHPAGNPNSHHAALAHFEAGRLEAFCVPWMPTPTELQVARKIPGLKSWARRLERRCFHPLLQAPRIEGRIKEWERMAKRIVRGRKVQEQVAYQANDWLMRTMKRECRRPNVTAVHSYEDCSLWQFEEAHRLGKACIYDMPIGYYPAWQETARRLNHLYADWLPSTNSCDLVRPEQKRKEMELADLVLAPSDFVRGTIKQKINKTVAVAPYGVDSDQWRPGKRTLIGPLTFLFSGQLSVRKGVPVLLEAWQKAELKNARLELVGSWGLAEAKRRSLPPFCSQIDAVSRSELARRYQAADVLVLPTFFEGRSLVVGEALACGLPVITTVESGATDLLDQGCSRVVESGNLDDLIDALGWFSQHRHDIPAMSRAAREAALCATWDKYQEAVTLAVVQFCN